MAVVTTRYNSVALGGFVSFTAVLPFEDFGSDFLNPNPDPYHIEKPLRTIYLLHGITGDEKDWLYGTRIERYAIENKIAVIMPDGDNNFYIDNNLTDRWGEFIGKELVQFTRNLFPLSDKREDTYIGGLSMGGYGAIRNGLKYSETFSKIVALSSALVTYEIPTATEDAPMPFMRRSWYERRFGDVTKLKGSDMDPEQLFLDCKNPMQIFMAIGEDDFLKTFNHMYRDFLTQHNADVTYMEGPGNHEWNFWDTFVEKGLKWINEN